MVRASFKQFHQTLYPYSSAYTFISRASLFFAFDGQLFAGSLSSFTRIFQSNASRFNLSHFHHSVFENDTHTKSHYSWRLDFNRTFFLISDFSDAFVSFGLTSSFFCPPTIVVLFAIRAKIILSVVGIFRSDPSTMVVLLMATKLMASMRLFQRLLSYHLHLRAIQLSRFWMWPNLSMIFVRSWTLGDSLRCLKRMTNCFLIMTALAGVGYWPWGVEEALFHFRSWWDIVLWVRRRATWYAGCLLSQRA